MGGFVCLFVSVFIRFVVVVCLVVVLFFPPTALETFTCRPRLK